MTALDRARLRELLDTSCACTELADEEVCPRCLGLLHADVPALLDALDEAEKALRLIITGGNVKTGSTEENASADSRLEALAEIARKALARIGGEK